MRPHIVPVVFPPGYLRAGAIVMRELQDQQDLAEFNSHLRSLTRWGLTGAGGGLLGFLGLFIVLLNYVFARDVGVWMACGGVLVFCLGCLLAVAARFGCQRVLRRAAHLAAQLEQRGVPYDPDA